MVEKEKQNIPEDQLESGLVLMSALDRREKIDDDAEAEWLFRCFCGDYGIASLGSLTSGEVTHCGCLFE